MGFYGGSNPINGTGEFVQSINGQTGAVSLELTTDEEAQALIEAAIAANTNLGALAPSVQVLVDAAKDRSTHTGNDPATNVVLSSGQTLQAYVNNLEVRLIALGSTAPVNTVQPTAPTGSVSVTSTLTAVTGTWTGASTYLYAWYRVNTTTGAITATGGVSSTYVIQIADTGYKIACAIAGVSAAGLQAAYVLSATTATITSTLPTISVAPAVTPSGSQAVGTLLTTTNGTWTNGSGAAYTYQWTLAGVAISGATSSTYTLLAGQEGGSVTCQVVATTTQGSSLPASSNTITVTGSPVLAFTAAPAWPSTVTVGTAATVTNATYTGGTATLVSSRIYAGTMTVPYATLTANPAVYTPETDVNLPQALINAGYTTLAGVTVYVDQVWSLSGTQYTSAKSAGKVVQAVSATLAATTGTTGIAWTQSTAITSVKPVSATGGTLPYSYSISPALPSGLSINSSTGFISGTPTTTASQTTYTVTVTDAVAATANSTFTATTSAAAVTPLANAFASIPTPDPFGWSGVYEIEAPDINDSTPYNSKPRFNALTAPIPPYSNLETISLGGVTRFGPATVDGLSVLRHEVRSTDPLRHDGQRSELAYDMVSCIQGVDYWFAFALKLDSDWTFASSSGDDRQAIWQVHQQDTTHNIGATIQLQWHRTFGSGSEIQLHTTNSNTSANQTRSSTAGNPGGWQRHIIHMRAGLSSGQAPVVEHWVANGTGSYTKLTDPNAGALWGDSDTTSSNPDFPKIGIYKYGFSYGSRSKTGMYSSGQYFGIGASLFAESAAAIAAFAI